jgi:hypothetical protein
MVCLQSGLYSPRTSFGTQFQIQKKMCGNQDQYRFPSSWESENKHVRRSQHQAHRWTVKLSPPAPQPATAFCDGYGRMQQLRSALWAVSIRKGKSDNARGPIVAIGPDCRNRNNASKGRPGSHLYTRHAVLFASRQIIDRVRLQLPELNPLSITLRHFACRRVVSCAILCPQRQAAQCPMEPELRCVIAGLVTHTVQAPHFGSVATERMVLTFRFSSGCRLSLSRATMDPQLGVALAASRLLTSWVW